MVYNIANPDKTGQSTQRGEEASRTDCSVVFRKGLFYAGPHLELLPMLWEVLFHQLLRKGSNRSDSRRDGVHNWLEYRRSNGNGISRSVHQSRKKSLNCRCIR